MTVDHAALAALGVRDPDAVDTMLGVLQTALDAARMLADQGDADDPLGLVVAALDSLHTDVCDIAGLLDKSATRWRAEAAVNRLRAKAEA